MRKTLEQLKEEVFEIGHDGHVQLVDVMGDDAAIVQAARVSYGKGTKTLSEDAQLIRYLMRHRHTTPFEMCEIKLRIRIPMDAWRQWIRHRTANVNEYSTRYSEAIDSMAITDPDKWRLQSGTNKQGSAGYLPYKDGEWLSVEEAKLHAHAEAVYRQRLEAGVAREQARKDLPLSTHTAAYWKIDLHNLLHFLSLRMDEHAQLEIREYANVIGEEIVAHLFPITWKAFLDYRLEAMTLSKLDIEMVNRINKSVFSFDAAFEFECEKHPFVDLGWGNEKCRERDECRTKLVRLGMLYNSK